jgi:transposase
MAWCRIQLTEDEQRIVNEERASHPNLSVRNKMLTIWLLHCGVTRQKAAEIVGVSRATVQRSVDAYCQGGLDGLRRSNVRRPVSELDGYRDIIRASFEEAPVCTIAEACDRIEKLTGIHRSPTQVRKFLKGLGLKWQRIRAIPVPPKKTLAEHVQDQAEFLDTKLKPQLDAAQAGQGHVFFVDAAHFVFGTFLCCLWSFTRIFVRAASGRQRFNVLGAWNAVTRELVAVTNTTVVNTETMCELVRKIAGLALTGPITLVLDNARYQRNAVVQAWAAELGISLLFLPSYSPNLNLIERLWKFTKRRALYGRYHPTFRDFQAAIQEVLDGLSTNYSEQLASLMTLNFQQFDDVSLMAA